jgi:hypothetical protein
MSPEKLAKIPRLAVELDVVVLEELTGGWPLAFVGNFGV